MSFIVTSWSWPFIGKLLETVGAGLLAYTVIRAAYIQIRVGSKMPSSQNIDDADLNYIRQMLRLRFEQLKMQFGVREAVFSAVGAAAFFFGSLISMIAM